MVRKRELVKQRGAFDSMSLAECVEVRAQCFQDCRKYRYVVKLGNQLQRFIMTPARGGSTKIVEKS